MMLKSDTEIERDVNDELKWSPDLDASDIAVSVRNGLVTLAGFVKSHTDKYEAEYAAKRLAGVVGLANDLELRLPSIDGRPDPDIARDVAAALERQLPISSENIKVVVKDGWVTLEGDVEWQYQRDGIEKAMRRIKGVRAVSNTILYKLTEIDSNRITVEMCGREVVLKGKGRSWIAREEAERAAWAAPGVTKDQIVVSPNRHPVHPRRTTSQREFPDTSAAHAQGGYP
jgi:osmotically-inducible protein OsmY